MILVADDDVSFQTVDREAINCGGNIAYTANGYPAKIRGQYRTRG